MNYAPVIVMDGSYYSTRKFTWGANSVLPLLVSAPEVGIEATVNGAGTSQAITVSLFNDTLRGTTSGEVSYYLVDVDAGTSTLLHSGVIRGGVKWSDDDNILTFTVEQEVESVEVGYAPADDGYAAVNETTQASMWPMVWGDVSKLKAIPLNGEIATLSLVDAIDQDSTSLTLQDSVGKVGRHNLSGTYLMMVDGVRFQVESGLGDSFTILQSNMPFYEDLPISTNEKGDPQWITLDGDYAIVGKWASLSYGGKTYSNFCVEQDGNNYKFKYNWPTALGTGTITEVCGMESSSWAPFYRGANSKTAVDWEIDAGAPVVVSAFGEDTPSRYLIADHHISELVGVYAERDFSSYSKIDGRWQHIGSGRSGLVSFPYYTLVNGTLNGRNCAYLDITKDVLGSSPWKSDVYVSFRSGRTQNSAEIIESLLALTDYTPDAASFAAVAAEVAAYPCNFALTEKKDVMQLCQEIAYQSRCGLVVKNGTVYITYLSKAPVAALTLNDANVKDTDYILSTEDADSVIYDLSVVWRPNYYQRERLMRYGRNTNVGYKLEKEQFYIYSHEELVKMSLYFWGYRKCRSWNLISCSGFLPIYGHDPYAVAHVGTLTDQDGIIRAASFSPADMVCRYTIQGDAGDANFWLGDPAYPVATPTLDDPLAGDVYIEYQNSWTFSGNDTGHEEQEGYHLQFVSWQSKVSRGKLFTMDLIMLDKDGNRARINEDITFRIQNATDLDDVISPTSVRMHNGRLSAEFTIDGGTEEAAGCEVIAYVEDQFNLYAPAVTGVITLDGSANWCEWLDVPDVVHRGIPFLTGLRGLADLVVTITIDSGDDSDLITPNPVTLTLGEYESNEWIIDGGDGESTAMLHAIAEGMDVVSKSFIIRDHQQIPTIIKVTGTTGYDLLCSVYGKGPDQAATEIDQVVRTFSETSFLTVGEYYLAHKVGEIYYTKGLVAVTTIVALQEDPYNHAIQYKTRTLYVPEAGDESGWTDLIVPVDATCLT